jgi:hypothetical protein
MSDNSKTNSLKLIELRARDLLKKRHNTTQNQVFRRITNEIIFDKNTHLSTKFKEMIITEEPQSMFRRYYVRAEANKRLQKLCLFFSKNMLVFPNLYKTEENRYLLFNIYSKQIIIENEEVKTKNKYSVQNKRKSFLFGFGLYHNEEINKSEGDEIFNKEIREELDESDWKNNFKSKENRVNISSMAANGNIFKKIETNFEIKNKYLQKKEFKKFDSIEKLIYVIETAENKVGTNNQEKLKTQQLQRKASTDSNSNIQSFKKSNFKKESQETFYKSNKLSSNNFLKPQANSDEDLNYFFSENYDEEREEELEITEKDLIIDERLLLKQNKNLNDSRSDKGSFIENNSILQSRMNSGILKEAHNIRTQSQRGNLTENSKNQSTSILAQQIGPKLSIKDAFPLAYKFKKTEEFLRIKKDKIINEQKKNKILQETLLKFKEVQYQTLVLVNKSNINKKKILKESGLELELHDKENKNYLCENNYPPLLKNNSSNDCSINNLTSIYQTLTTQVPNPNNIKTINNPEKENLKSSKNKTVIKLQPKLAIKNLKSRNKDRRIQNAVYIGNKEVNKEFYTNTKFPNPIESNYLNTYANSKNSNNQLQYLRKTSEIYSVNKTNATRATEFNEYSTMSKSQTDNCKMKFILGVNNKKIKINKGSDKNTLPVNKVFFPFIK